MQHPALDRGGFYGLELGQHENTTFGREPAEDTSGHWVYAMLRHDARARATVLVVGNLSPGDQLLQPSDIFCSAGRFL